jgi:hypothetical protein
MMRQLHMLVLYFIVYQPAAYVFSSQRKEQTIFFGCIFCSLLPKRHAPHFAFLPSRVGIICLRANPYSNVYKWYSSIVAHAIVIKKEIKYVPLTRNAWATKGWVHGLVCSTIPSNQPLPQPNFYSSMLHCQNPLMVKDSIYVTLPNPGMPRLSLCASFPIRCLR